MQIQKSSLTAGGIAAVLAVLLGALGKHALKEKLNLPADRLEVFETAIRFQMYHAFALLIAGLLPPQPTAALLKYAARLFIFGIVLFSGSLYVLSIRSLIGFENSSWIGPLTPLGGLCFIAGWILLIIHVSKK